MQEYSSNDLPHERLCDCRDEPCPVEGQCLTENVIYQASVKRLDTQHIETYVGLSGPPFKLRYRVHKGNIRNSNESGTKLSKYVWTLKRENINFEIKWKFIAKASSYTPASQKCNLCNKEVYFILYKGPQATLNSRTELFNPCPHKRKFKLSRN